MARINRGTTTHLPVLVGNREVAHLINPALVDTSNPRAFELVSPMNNEEEAVFLSLAIFEMTKREFPKSA